MNASTVAIGLCCLLTIAAWSAPSVGVIADELVDYSTWAAGHRELWTGEEVARILSGKGLEPALLEEPDLTPQGLSEFDAILIATDHTYPERGEWGGPVARALAEYVRDGGIYVMPVGVPHYISKDLQTGNLDRVHWEDFFGLRAQAQAMRLPLSLTEQGEEIGLADPGHLQIGPIRALVDTGPAAVLIWDADFRPALTALPFGDGWLVHWGCGEDMGRPVRDYLIGAYADTIPAALRGDLQAMTRQELLEAEGVAGKSLDDLDRAAFAPGPAPFDGEPTPIELHPAEEMQTDVASGGRGVSLDGPWQMLGLPAGAGDERALLDANDWPDAITVNVPCSVQTALFAAGEIPNPANGFNDQIARAEVAENEWWFRREFRWDGAGPARLVFEGVDYSATFYLNGRRLGEHEGPFGGPEFDVTGLLEPRNTLIVRLDPLPPDWKLVFKTNCVYGWHYVNCPPIGIWRSVRVEDVPEVEIAELFVGATDANEGVVDASIVVRGPADGFEGRIVGHIRPANFQGDTWSFALPVQSNRRQFESHLRLTVPDPQLWWPNGLGPQNLYRMDLRVMADGEPVDERAARFGIRTIRMEPLPEGPRPDRYNWTFVINDRPTFVKGCNWCTVDFMLRLPESRYRRFLALAKDAHIQIMRSWGGGLLETDTFYDLCDELGIMVWQEFPLTWQRFEVIRGAVADEIAVRNIRRIRNHPSLVMWCGGNEHSGQGELIELLGRRCLQLDGTRAYHRTDPFGGSRHDYGVYWGMQPFEHNMTLEPPVISEFGLASPCAVESTLKYLPEGERDVWPPPDSGAFVHHTPTFTPKNMEHLNRYAKEFDECADLDGFTRGSQLAQATGLRILLERMRVRWPEATAALYYKLTDVYPGCSWSTVDWYGVPKIAHYVVQDAFAPLHVCAIYDSLDVKAGDGLDVRLVVVDDAEVLQQTATVSARLYDAQLQQVDAATMRFDAPARRITEIGTANLQAPGENSSPLLMVTECRSAGALLDRSFYWFNFRARAGCLFDLPRTNLEVSRSGDQLTVRNSGALPAVGVHFESFGNMDCLRFGDGYFWLDPGEERAVAVAVTENVEGVTNVPESVSAVAWNAEPVVVNMR